MGRCEPTTGIAPFGRLVHQVLAAEPYPSGDRLFWIVDNGSSHRGEAARQRLRQVDYKPGIKMLSILTVSMYYYMPGRQ